MRPEYSAPPEIYYNETEAKKYTQNSRIIEVQSTCTERALELLGLPEDKSCHLLDLGCGSGLSGEVLTENGHSWIGMDISPAMLDIAKQREIEGEVILGDLGEGLPFRDAMFDGAISISTLQWLCNADRKSHNPIQRLRKLFTTLYGCLKNGTRAVFQFYPSDDAQIDLISKEATKCGFGGGLVIDYPNSSKAKKIYLVLMCGVCGEMPAALADQSSSQSIYERREHINAIRKGKNKRVWIMERKERRRIKGQHVKTDSRYTGRTRPNPF